MDLNLFFGRFHLVLVHLPIGLLLLAVLMQLFSEKKRFEKLDHAIVFTLFLGTISAILAAICGWLLANEGDYVDRTLFLHRWMGIGLSILAGFCWLIKSKKVKAKRNFLTFLMGVLAFMMFYTGHLGGSLTHGEGYLLQYAPTAFKAVFGVKAETEATSQTFSNPDSTFVFNDLLLPVLKEKCGNCHDENNIKGGLVLTSKDGFLKGGDHDEIVLAGNAIESEIFTRVTLSRKDKKFMPPKGEVLSYDQIRLLEWWIDNGASFEKTVGEYDLTTEMERLFEKNYGLETSPKSFVETLKVTPISKATFQKLEVNNFKVTPLAANNNLVEISLKQGVKKMTTKQVETLLEAKEQITWLDLGNAEILDDHLSVINQLSNLTRLRLERTSISDKGIVLLEKLPNLESLNIYGNAVSDKAIEAIIKMPALKNVYLWQTQISPQGLEKIKNNRPDLEVIGGLEIAQ